MPNNTIILDNIDAWRRTSPDDYVPIPPAAIADDGRDEAGLIFRRSMAGAEGSSQAFAAAFDFLQRNADGRYTDRTLMAVSRIGFRCDEALRTGATPAEGSPSVFSLHREVTYDEDTEVKSGGTMALAVTIPAEYGNRLIMAVHPDARRQGYGQRLVGEAVEYVSGLHSYVGAANIVGQHFLLSLGMTPVAMTSSRALLYSYGDMPENEGVAR